LIAKAEKKWLPQIRTAGADLRGQLLTRRGRRSPGRAQPHAAHGRLGQELPRHHGGHVPAPNEPASWRLDKESCAKSEPIVRGLAGEVEGLDAHGELGRRFGAKCRRLQFELEVVLGEQRVLRTSDFRLTPFNRFSRHSPSAMKAAPAAIMKVLKELALGQAQDELGSRVRLAARFPGRCAPRHTAIQNKPLTACHAVGAGTSAAAHRSR